MKFRSFKWSTVIIIGLLMVNVVLISRYQPIFAQTNFDWLFGNNETALSEDDLTTIQDVYDNIQKLYIEDLDKETLVQGALKGMVEATGDPYSEFLSPDQAEEMSEDVEGTFSGIGVQFQMINDQPTVVAPIEGTPASEAGIQPNDIIVKSGDTELKGLDSNEIMRLIRGEIGTTVDLVIQRGEQTFDLTIERAEIPIITVTGEIDKNNSDVGYVKITQFNGTTANELKETVTKLRKDGAKEFIFDLRYNPGGLLDQVLIMGNMFLKDGQNIMQTEESATRKMVYTASDAEYGDFKIDEPYVFLINEGSASASEILASAVNENNGTRLVGQKSFGKGSVQSVMPQGKYGELKLTVAKWLTPNGSWIHEKGIPATDEVEPNPLEAAILLNTKDTYQLGASDPAVATIGTTLSLLDYDLQSKEYFDEKMEQAIRAFQKDHQLKETGIVDAETIPKLNEEARRLLKEIDPQYDRALEILKEQANKLQEAA